MNVCGVSGFQQVSCVFLFYVDWLVIVRWIGNCLNTHTPSFLVQIWEVFYRDLDLNVGGILIKYVSDL